HYLNIQTKHPLLNAVTDQLVYQNVNTILNRGFEEMMNKKMYDTLSTLYTLLLNNSNMSLLRASFGDYIKNYGVALIKDPKKDASMVSSLLDFKKELDQILQNCFQNDTTFTNALKEGFEYFINTRQNKPAEMIAKYLDTRLKAPAKKQARTSDDDIMTTVDYVLTLFRFVQDAFEAYYKRYLAKRLLLERSLSMEAECQVVEKLKSQCGHEFTKNFETMLKDIHVSFDLIQDFKEKSQYPIYVKVITQAVWPSYSATSLTLSPEMIKCQEAYHQFYASRFKGRKLIWQNSLSSCVLIAHFPKETKELSMSLPQAAVLLLFNRLDKPTWTVNEIKEATSLEDSELSRTLLSLSTGSYAVLIKVKGGSGPLVGTDTFQFNTDFEAAGVRLKIPAIQQEQTVEEKKEVESKVLVNRQHQLEAAIVRIMKANKTLSQEDLLNQVFQQVKFPVNFYLDCDEYGVWPLVADDLSARLPLRNLKWQPSSQRAECLISTLEVDLKRFTPDPSPLPLPSTTQTVYLNLYFVTCEDNEVYKTRIRKNIRSWLDLVQSKKIQEWLIVYVAEADTKRSNNYLGLKSSIFDKIRTDFNPPKQDRCVFIRKRDPEGPQSGLWTAFIEKMKECILSSFDMQVLQIQEDTRRLDMQRHMPGWNYCTFFILKEGLAQAFEIMTLYEDALIQYDELEASFFQVLKDKALAWFGHFGGTDPGDDSGNVLDFKRKNYRDMINKNMISVFDFRCYLFARQCRMLLKMHKVIEVTARAQLFITNFILSIRENESNLPDNFVESWVFSACMNVVNECEALSAQVIAQHPELAVPYNAVKADLLLTARRQLDKIGIRCKHLPMTDPFSIYINHTLDAQQENDNEKPARGITNTKLIEAMQSVEAFDKTYMGLSTRAIKSYDASFRSRAALNVHGDIAALKYIRGKYEEAVRIYESVIWRYGEQEWGSIENSLLIKCADSQKRLGKANQYVESLLALLRNAIFLSAEESSFYTDELINHVGTLDKEIKRPFSPIFSVHVMRIIDDPNIVETSSVEVCIDNHLPKKIGYDTISLQMCEMKLGKLIFSHNFLHAGQKKRTVRLNHDIKQLYATASQPNEICLGERQKVSVKISSREAKTTRGLLLLESQTEEVQIVNVPKVTGVLHSDSMQRKGVAIGCTGNRRNR
ncbi:hypothetical protein CU097_000946, partial [Rhizopus azygosporus]